jgi:hypothetical protein
VRNQTRSSASHDGREQRTANVCSRKELNMRKVALAILGAFVLGFVAAPAVSAGADPQALSKQCQDALKKTPNAEASKLCSDGDKALKEGKKDEAAAKFSAGLEKLGVKAETPMAPEAPAKKPGY